MGPDHGALGITFKAARGLQAASMIAIIGITANFISEMVSASAAPPPVLVGILSIVCKAGRASSGENSPFSRSALQCYTVQSLSFFTLITSFLF